VLGQISILGPGLLGGSLALALGEARLARRIVVWARRPEAVADVRGRGLADLSTADVREAVAEADLVVLCTPVGAMPTLARRFAPALRQDAVATDVGSVKTRVTHELEAILQPAHRFVGAHPMAGSERGRIDGARPDLLRGAPCILTPTPSTDPAALRLVARFWRALGCRVHRVAPETHDAIVGALSHLPHLVASALVDLAAAVLPAHLRLCGNGFRDVTRIAASPAGLWAEILCENRANVIESLDGLLERLAALRGELAAADPDALRRRLERARRVRRGLEKKL